MQSYHDLSDAGKLRRLHALASEALARYDLRSPEIRYHGFSTNLLYRVTTASGQRFMLRLASPGWRTYSDLYSEALWLEALYRDTTIQAPHIIAARCVELVLPLSGPDVPVTWNCSLMTWVPGRLLGHYLTECNLEKMGELFATLHEHGTAWTPPA